MLENGRVIRSIAGHDKDKFYAVVGSVNDYVLIADGRLRKLENPKRKNVRHIRTTNTLLDLSIVNTNKQLRLVLKPFNEALQNGAGRV